MKKSTIGAMVLALLLGSFALAYGVGEASAQPPRGTPRAALAHESRRPRPLPTDREPTPAVSRRRRPTPRHAADAAAEAQPERPSRRCTPARTLLGPRTTGTEVRDLQARLRQIAWYFGNVTDTYGPADHGARSRASRPSARSPVTGYVDQRTLDRLHAMTRTPTDDELAQPLRRRPATPTRGSTRGA